MSLLTIAALLITALSIVINAYNLYMAGKTNNGNALAGWLCAEVWAIISFLIQLNKILN